jgi:hypothetical protein
MLLAGLAIQIKYAVVFEGVFFGLSLLWAGWRSQRPPARLVSDALAWIGCALAPSLAAWAFYATRDLGGVFVQANFLSFFADRAEFAPALARLGWQALGLAPFFACGWVAWRRWRTEAGADRARRGWPIAWAAASYAGYLALGNWFDHYVLPVLAPMSLLAALAFDALPAKRLAMALLIGLGAAAGLARTIVDMADRGSAGELARLTAMVERHLHRGCLYVDEDVPILYLTTRSCLPTRFAFPDHLALKRYRDALGVDQRGEMRGLLARRPDVIVMLSNPDTLGDYATRDLLEGELARGYSLVGKAQTGAKVFAVFAARRPPVHRRSATDHSATTAGRPD